MLANLSGWHLIAALIVVIAAIVIVIVLANRSAKRKQTPEYQQQQAFEAGRRQAELQGAYEAGLNAQRPPQGPKE